MQKIDNTQKDKMLIGFKKARTSLNKIVDSLEKEENFEGKCFNIIQQNLAVIGLLKAANVAILESYLDFYIENIDKTTKKVDVEKMKQEILRIVQTAQKK